MGPFKGEGAKGVIYNHAHMQLPTIHSIRTFLISFSDTLEKMKAQINEYEPTSNGSVSEDFWKNQLPEFDLVTLVYNASKLAVDLIRAS